MLGMLEQVLLVWVAAVRSSRGSRRNSHALATRIDFYEYGPCSGVLSLVLKHLEELDLVWVVDEHAYGRSVLGDFVPQRR